MAAPDEPELFPVMTELLIVRFSLAAAMSIAAPTAVVLPPVSVTPLIVKWGALSTKIRRVLLALIVRNKAPGPLMVMGWRIVGGVRVGVMVWGVPSKKLIAPPVIVLLN